ncbi:tyrosine-type recombinase/integrase [Chloroflexota bacterium]
MTEIVCFRCGNKPIKRLLNGEYWCGQCNKSYSAAEAKAYFIERMKETEQRMLQKMIESHLIARMGAKSVSALSADDLNFIVADMIKAGKSATTIRYVLRIIHRVLEDAVRKGKLTRNIADLADPPQATKPESQVWNEVEFDGFLTAAAESEFYEYFSTLALTGARRGEALGLRWRDVDLDITAPKLYIRRTAYKLDNGQWRFEEPKTKRSRRVIPLPISLALLLGRLHERQEAHTEWCGQKFSEDNFVFARLDGSLPDPHYLSKVFRQVVAGAGLKPIRLHDLRHTCATLLRKAGQPIEAISKVLGHASELVTLAVYDHWEGELRAPADIMDQMLERASKNKVEGAFVRKTLEEGEGIERGPCLSQTYNHLIKSQVLIFSQFFNFLIVNPLRTKPSF